MPLMDGLRAGVDAGALRAGEIHVATPAFSSGNDGPGSSMPVWKDPRRAVCRDGTDAERCADEALGLTPTVTAGHHVEGDGVTVFATAMEPAQKTDIPKYIAKAAVSI
jgi:hypothetical protein